MFKIKRIGIIICAVSIILVGGVATKSFADTRNGSPSSDFGPQQKMTPEEEKKVLESIGAIYNDFGEFRRVSSTQSLDTNEIAYTENSINSRTKELILDYGIFVKVCVN
ncbi:hypothetical protein [Cohnella lupini]|uniref:hypothetical protein n=1 Tax=Cohnella lupini TaxID=1294267 RepID=UPI0011C05422|nr:hypothetical protein [Cohnella lupini]